MKFPKLDAPASEGSGSNLFLKLKDGESVTGVFRGELYEFFSKWTGNKSIVTSSLDPEGKQRFRANIVVYEDGQFRAKIWEFGRPVCAQLKDINDEYPLDKTKVKITRRGTGTDTTYMILPILKEPLSAKHLAEIEGVALNILEHRDKPEAPQVPVTDDELEF